MFLLPKRKTLQLFTLGMRRGRGDVCDLWSSAWFFGGKSGGENPETRFGEWLGTGTRGTNVPRVSTSYWEKPTQLLTDKKIQLLYYDVSFAKTENFTIIYIQGL